ncbi:hypothetical protein BV898_19345 [Hypsibius exemplaris]|uniref:Nuclear receptor domain-containing protein n=1 Tax=Hypsibius exemplaris TaxID=2072580 RepID=A0A9X6NLA4_HYPEX|nr:hypothetical protein BV898_19345 [Hypsibius exemplaris]
MKCEVCSVRRATGAHYSVPACEGCKAFFRRTIENSRVYLCKFEDKCVIRVHACCRACRYRKCLNVGMKVTVQRQREDKPHTNPSGQQCVPAKFARENDQDSTGSTGSDSEGSPSPMGRSEVQSPCDTNHLVPYHNPREMDDLSPVYQFHKTDLLDYAIRTRWSTLQALELTAEVVFGGQVQQSAESTGAAFRAAYTITRPESEAGSENGSVQEAVCKCMVCVKRNQQFISMLPGTVLLNPSIKRNLTADWKWMTFWLMRNVDRVIHSSGLEHIKKTDDPNSHINSFIYDFCKELNDIGLNQTEKCLLLAVAILEPDSSADGTVCVDSECVHLLQTIHGHYMNVLVETLKQRCSDSRHLSTVCQKLVRFFCSLKDVCRLHRRYIAPREYRLGSIWRKLDRTVPLNNCNKVKVRKFEGSHEFISIEPFTRSRLLLVRSLRQQSRK